MKKRLFISIILLSLVIIAIFAQQSCGEYPCVLVTPEPPPCKQVDKIYMCASTACAMVMKYWANNQVVNDKNCTGYQSEFKKEFGSNDGSAHPPQIAPALKKIGKANLIDPYKNADVETIAGFDLVGSYSDIIEYLKYSNKNKEISPWDRPGVLIYLTNNGAHAVCAWGYYKGPLNTKNLPEDPNASMPPEPTGTNIPKNMRWGIVYRIHDGQSTEKYFIIPQDKRGKYSRKGEMIFVWFNKNECPPK
jgi:hypothetical protein